MRICELELKHYGRFSNQKFKIAQGINVIYGENEYGKTTIHSFIKGMLFGMERGRGRASKTDEFSQYEPWDNPNYYAGKMVFEVEGRNFCIERDFDRYGKRASLICMDDGEELSVEMGDLDMLLDGVTAGNYENTIAVGQLRIETGRDLVSELKDYATNYYGTADSDIHLEKSLNLMNSKKKLIQHKLKELQGDKEVKRGKLEVEASYIEGEIQKEKLELNQVQQSFKQEALAEEFNGKTEGEAESRWTIHPIFYLLMLAVLVVPVFVLPRPFNYLTPIVILIAEGIYVWNRFKDGRKKKRTLDEETRQQKQQKAERYQWQLERLLSDIKEKQIMYDNLIEQMEELEKTGDEESADQKHIEAIDMAMERLNSLSKEIHQEFGRKFSEKASLILAEITGGRYQKLYIDGNLNMSLYRGDKRISIQQVSRGTIEQVYFALRMAAADVLHKEEQPVILDDTFVFYDETRLANVLRWLAKNKKQVLIFTCQHRELELLDKMKIPYTQMIEE